MPSAVECSEHAKQFELSDLIDAVAVQEMMNDYYTLTGIGIGIIDRNGTVLVGTGWQDICVSFHRAHPESCRHCLESDLELSGSITPGTFKAYRCKNNMWDIATPIMLGDRHIGTIFLGQFLYDDEAPDYDLFRAQARRYGYDETAYLAALDRVPRWSRETVRTAMSYYSKLARLISSLTFSNALLTDSLKLGATSTHLLGQQMLAMENVDRCLSLDPTTPVPPAAAEPVHDDRSPVPEQDVMRRFLRGWSLIQERIRTSRALERAKQEWEQTFDAVPDLIAIIDTNHKILRVNRAMARKCGTTPSDLVGRHCFEVMHGGTCPPAFCLHNQVLTAPAEYSGEIHEPLLNGIYDVTVSPLYHPDGSVRASVHVARDITRRKRAEQERERLEEQVRHAERLHAVGTLAGGVAHDFNNILAVITGYGHIVQTGLPADHPQQDNLRMIMEAAGRAAHLTRDLLLFSRKNPANRQPLDLSMILHRAERFLDRLIGTNISLVIVSEPRDPLLVYGDEQQLGQVIMNLATNARDAMPDGGMISIGIEEVELTADEAVALGLVSRGRYARITVSDSGVGISPDRLTSIFDPFYTTKEPGKGTGLGLSIVYGIIKSHDGSIQAASTPGSGTTFTMHLPVCGDQTLSAEPGHLP